MTDYEFVECIRRQVLKFERYNQPPQETVEKIADIISLYDERHSDK